MGVELFSLTTLFFVCGGKGGGVIFEFFIWANLDLMASMHSEIVTDNLSKCFFWGALQWAISVSAWNGMRQ